MQFAIDDADLVKDGLKQTLRQAISANLLRLPLERFCEKGGHPLSPQLTHIEAFEPDVGPAQVSFVVSFTETGAACCSGDCFEHPREAAFSLRYSRSTGVAQLVET